MNQYVAQLPWTDEQWARVTKTVKQEAERTRVAAKFLPIYGPVGEDQVAVPNLALSETGIAPLVPAAAAAVPGLSRRRLDVDSSPQTALATISMLVYVRGHEASDPELQAALTMFRRAANILARTEDALMFNGQADVNEKPVAPGGAIDLAQVTYGRPQNGLVGSDLGPNLPDGHQARRVRIPQRAGLVAGQALIEAVVDAIDRLEQQGYGGPYACVLANDLYRDAHTPTDNLVLPRHTIVPMLEDGPLLRSSTIKDGWGIVVSRDSGQVEQVLASEICVKFLHVSEEPRFV
ncbi:MAG TPA: encapsulin, partial [Polyangiaceae bacterium]